ncbi:lipid IV(A) 3-deoxy-D-manno-octulosonic acid transferase [Pseudidiomarina marina]|uniref:lipid IV(A) 3-deoxy-D-manno-octulosonic acid transferase n=1 Tax=Pseudidiomarina marina TaxID=502366 RepID=UPI00384BA834
MTVWYKLLIRFATPLVFIYLWLRGAKASAYRERWSERLALQKIPPQVRDGIVIHCVSVGETVAARGLIERVLRAYPHLSVTLTSMTPTAAEMALKLFGERVFHSYLPIDTPGAMKRFVSKLNPRLLIVLETEVWPCLLEQCHLRNIPVLVVNARMSERSAKSYQKYAWLLGPIWQRVNFIAAQTNASAERFEALKVPNDKLAVRGNLKHDFQVSDEIHQQAKSWRDELNRPVLVAASTHDGEDAQILEAFSSVLGQHPNALLIIVPRHPERFDSVARLIEQQQFSYVRRSTAQTVQPSHQVFLADSMGELLLWYAVADAAFVGGSLIERGGHNPLEPIATHTAVISGPHVFNFDEIYQRLKAVDGVHIVADAKALAAAWNEWLAHPQQATQHANHAFDEFANDQGATEAILQDIERFAPFARNAEKVRTMSMIKTAKPNDKMEIWYDPSILDGCTSDHFDASFWQSQNKVKGSATGRSTAFFVDAGEHGLLLRHYYRGGLVGKVNKDRFKREPIANSRAMAEFSLLLKLRELALPVPRPVAARYVEAPVWGYRADILVEVIPNAQDLFKLLLQRSLTDSEWQQVGRTIRELHSAGVYHSDLNCHNIMLDDNGKCWIVDFDKCGFKAEGEWREANLQRLLRSFNKELTKAKEANRAFHFNETRDWPLLVDAYS